MTAPLHLLLLDGGDASVVQSLLDAGRLPALGRLRARGATIRISTMGEALEESTAPALLAGSRLGDVGVVHFHAFDPPTMGLRFEREVNVEPFWLHLPGRGDGVSVLDLPQVHPHPDARARHVCAWNAFSPPHRAFAAPPSVLRDLPAPTSGLTEFERPPTLEDEQALSRRLCGLVHERAGAARRLSRGAQITVTGVHETHAAVHCLGHHWISDHWHQPFPADPTLVTMPYEAIDAAFAPLLDDPDANVVVALWNGIRPANPADHLLEELLVRSGFLAPWGQAKPAVAAARQPLATRVRALVPAAWRERVALTVLPDTVQHALASRRFRDQYDWSRTIAFPLPTWTSGFVRLNLRGREAAGVVDPPDAEAVLDRITAVVAATVDADTGLPLVKRVLRTAVELPGTRQDQLPDLILMWAADRPVRRASHPDLGTWGGEPVIHRHRFSHHSNGGLVLVGGPGVRHVDTALDGDPMDLAPTLLALAGVRNTSLPGRSWDDALSL